MSKLPMNRLLLTGLTLLIVIAGATAAFALVGDDSPARNASTTTSTNEDVSGPCDEAEHANDPRCAGNGQASDDDGAAEDHHGGRGRDHAEDDGMDEPGDDDGVDDDAGEDISGPCDEAEHANDPECTGSPVTPPADDGVDNSGPGSINSGPGSVDDDDGFEDNSGSGSFDDDDGFEDNSGSGSSGSGSSGHGDDDDD